MQETIEFIRLIDRVTESVKALPQRIATVAVNFSKERFRAQNWVDYTTEPWRKRKTRDKQNGRAILVKSGRLRRSTRKILVTDDCVIVGSDVPDAPAHNNGFRGTVTVKQHQRHQYKASKEKYKTKSGKNRTRTIRVTSGSFTVKSHTRRVNLPRRRFIGPSAVLNNQIQRLITAEITHAVKGI